MEPAGLLTLNARSGPADPNATIIVSGPPRSGTSLVAAALRAAGLWIGDGMDNAVFEDAEMAYAIEVKAPVWRRPAVLLSGGPLRLALRGIDLPVLRRSIANRNARFSTWGFKRPNVAPILRADGLRLFRNPKMIVTLRDPLAIAERAMIAEELNLKRALDAARRSTHANLKVLAGLGVPTLLVSYERMKDNRRRGLEEIFRFAGLSVSAEDFLRVEDTIRRSGDDYRRIASAPVKGYIGEYRHGVLSGWCRRQGEDAPVLLDVYVDDGPVAQVLADAYRPDLKKAGIGDGRHGFDVRLDAVVLGGDSRIRVVVAGSDVEIENSGRRLSEFGFSR